MNANKKELHRICQNQLEDVFANAYSLRLAQATLDVLNENEALRKIKEAAKKIRDYTCYCMPDDDDPICDFCKTEFAIAEHDKLEGVDENNF